MFVNDGDDADAIVEGRRCRATGSVFVFATDVVDGGCAGGGGGGVGSRSSGSRLFVVHHQSRRTRKSQEQRTLIKIRQQHQHAIKKTIGVRVRQKTMRMVERFIHINPRRLRRRDAVVVICILHQVAQCTQDFSEHCSRIDGAGFRFYCAASQRFRAVNSRCRAASYFAIYDFARARRTRTFCAQSKAPGDALAGTQSSATGGFMCVGRKRNTCALCWFVYYQLFGCPIAVSYWAINLAYFWGQCVCSFVRLRLYAVIDLCLVRRRKTMDTSGWLFDIVGWRINRIGVYLYWMEWT